MIFLNMIAVIENSLHPDKRSTAHLAEFNPANPGTSNAEWMRMLASRPKWEPKPGALFIVSPHPDDEILACGGLIRQWALSGNAVTVISVTDGEKAHPAWQGLNFVRRRELTEALRVLVPVHVAVRRIGIPDGAVGAHAFRLRNAIENLLDPGATLVAPYESDGHPDHEAAGRVCAEVAQAMNTPLARYPIWAWHQSAPNALGQLRWAKYSMNADTQRAKSRAVQCFESQISPRGLEPILPGNVLQYFSRSYEAYIL